MLIVKFTYFKVSLPMLRSAMSGRAGPGCWSKSKSLGSNGGLDVCYIFERSGGKIGNNYRFLDVAS